MLRTILIWLLVLALPAQGAIAATMVFCGPSHHGSSVVATSAAVDDAHAEHHQHSHTTQAHDDVADGGANDSASAESAAPASPGQADTKKCSVCASCCSANAIHSTAAKLPVLEPGRTLFTIVVPVIEPFAADGPDRPPRHSLA